MRFRHPSLWAEYQLLLLTGMGALAVQSLLIVGLLHQCRARAQTALAESISRLRALEQLRDDLVRMVVHDMWSPLQALRINLMLLNNAFAALSEDDREILQAASALTEEIGRMTSDMFDVSRLEECRMPVKKAVCDLTQIARDVRSVMGAIGAERSIDIESGGPVEVSCDCALVRRVMENFVSNGIRHTPAGGPIRISIVRGQGRVRVAVHDQGHGVPPEARTKIFEKFGTVEARQESDYQSAGLGLAFCKLAIDAHGGTIGVDPGVPAGSTFWFELPA